MKVTWERKTVRPGEPAGHVKLMSLDSDKYLNLIVGDDMWHGANKSFSPDDMRALRDKLNELYPLNPAPAKREGEA